MSNPSKNSEALYLLSPDLRDRLRPLFPQAFSLGPDGQRVAGEAEQQSSLSKGAPILAILGTEYIENNSLSLEAIAAHSNTEHLAFILLAHDYKYAEQMLKAKKLPIGSSTVEEGSSTSREFHGIILPASIESEYLLFHSQKLLSQIKSSGNGLKPPAEPEAETNKQRHEEEKLMLLNISKTLATEKNFEVLVSIILDEVCRVVCADGGSIYIVEDSKVEGEPKKLRFKRSALLLDSDEFSLPIDTNSIAGYVALTGQPLLIKNVYNLPADLPFSFNPAIDRKHNYHTKSMLVLPMINQLGEIMGVLQLINRKRNYTQKLSIEDMRGAGVLPFSREDYQIANAIANQSAIALYNQKLIEGQRNLLESFIQLIDGAIDSKSEYTGGHCHRVPILTEMLAKAICDAKEGPFADFDLNEDEWYELRIAAGLHDCGKIVTPVHVMDKATKLETIFDRVVLINLRLELLRRDAKEQHLQRMQKRGMDSKESEALLIKRLHEIEDMQKFIEKVNIGGEFLSQEDIQKIEEIGQEQYRQNGNYHPLLSESEIYNLSVNRGTLTKEERLTINGHMVETVKMLEALPFPINLQRVAEYACGHHEKMDGTGYPRGIFGGDMSIPARIMAVADVFEALTARDRPYKKGKSLSETMQIMTKMKASNHFDPDIFDIFISSGTYKKYAEKYLPPGLIDAIDEEEILKIKPKGFTLPPKEERMQRWKGFLPEYRFLDKKSYKA